MIVPLADAVSVPARGVAVGGGAGRSWGRVDGVDVLRGMAILFVVLNHVHMRLLLAHVEYVSGFAKRIVAAFVWDGQFGVQMFFAVSGFLITATTLRRWGGLARVSVWDFYRLRFARIAPMLGALLVVLIGLHYLGDSRFVVTAQTGGLWRAVVAAVTLHVNVLQAHRGWLPAAWGVLWSLSVEEMFYLFFPVVARFLGRGKIFVVVLLCFVAMGPLARTVWAHGNEVWEEQSYLGGMDAIAMGCLTALIGGAGEIFARGAAGDGCGGSGVDTFYFGGAAGGVCAADFADGVGYDRDWGGGVFGDCGGGAIAVAWAASFGAAVGVGAAEL